MIGKIYLWIKEKFDSFRSDTVQIKMQTLEEERIMPGYGKKGKGKTTKMKKQAATAISMKKAGKKPKKKM